MAITLHPRLFCPVKMNLLFIIESTTFLKTAEIVFFHTATVITCLVNHKTAFHCISHPNDGLPPVSITAILTECHHCASSFSAQWLLIKTCAKTNQRPRPSAFHQNLFAECFLSGSAPPPPHSFLVTSCLCQPRLSQPQKKHSHGDGGPCAL